MFARLVSSATPTWWSFVASAAASSVSYFVVPRSQVLVGDALEARCRLQILALSLPRRPGSTSSSASSSRRSPSRWGMGLLGDRARPDDVVIGSVFAWCWPPTFFLSILHERLRAAQTACPGRLRPVSYLILGSRLLDARLLWLIAAPRGLRWRCSLIARPLPFRSRARLDPARSLGSPLRSSWASASSSCLGWTPCRGDPGLSAPVAAARVACVLWGAARLLTR